LPKIEDIESDKEHDELPPNGDDKKDPESASPATAGDANEA